MSEWLVMDAGRHAGVPQGSYLGPLMFITLVDSLRVSCMMHKFVDDTTLSEFITKSGRSDNACCDELVLQSNEMNVNGRKTRDADGSHCERSTATHFAVRNNQLSSSIQASRGPCVQRLEVDGLC